MRGMKDNLAARRLFADYDKIPKSVFATIAWHFADLLSEGEETGSGPMERFLKEWTILHDGGHIPQKPLTRVELD